MKKYALLGTYDNINRNNVEVIATSDNPEKLDSMMDAINQINSKLCDDRCMTKEIENIIDQHLLEVDLYDEITDYISEIDVLGIFQIRQIEKVITKTCGFCGKLLYEGTESGAKGLVIYCTDCAQNSPMEVQ